LPRRRDVNDRCRNYLINYARSAYKRFQEKNSDCTWEDALAAAFDELDEGWGIFIDPTHDEWDKLLRLAQGDRYFPLAGDPRGVKLSGACGSGEAN